MARTKIKITYLGADVVRRRPSARRGRRGGHLHRSQPRGVHEVGHPPALTLSAGPPEVLEQPVGVAGAYEGENGPVAASGFGSNGRELVESRAEPPVAARCALGGGGGYSHGGTVRRYLHAPRREGRARGRREILVSVLLWKAPQPSLRDELSKHLERVWVHLDLRRPLLNPVQGLRLELGEPNVR